MEIIKADTIEQYNRFFGFRTQHPLVSVVHFNGSEKQPDTHRMIFGPSITGKRNTITMMKPLSVLHRGRP